MNTTYIKHAVRIAKKVNSDNILAIRVLVHSDKQIKKLEPSSVNEITRLIQDHLQGVVTLPLRGGVYSHNEWDHIKHHWALHHPMSQDILRKANDWLVKMTAEHGEKVIKGIYGHTTSETNPLRRIHVWAHSIGVELGFVPEEERTPATLKKFAEKIEKYTHKTREYMESLSDPALYDKYTNPQYVVDTLRSTHARYSSRDILKVIHKIVFNDHPRPGYTGLCEPTFYDVLDERMTLTDLLDIRHKEELVIKNRMNTWASNMLETITRVLKHIEPLETYHLPTINRVLNANQTGCRICRTKSSGKDIAVLEIREIGYLHGIHLSDIDTVESLISYMKAIIDAADRSPVISHNDYFSALGQAEGLIKNRLQQGSEVLAS